MIRESLRGLSTGAGLSALSLYLLMPYIHKVLPLVRQIGTMARPAETFSMAFVTAPTADAAKELASGLVSARLAACVNIMPGITSVYEWEGKVNTDPEVLMMIKTRTSRIPELTEFVQKNHPYDVPEVITTSIEGGSQPYLAWLGERVPEISTIL